eukprot:TRINITY_DN8506_c0_g1_i2.p1 TRINITY_DN8506_c0_g1~~TRINITY_DN8506_c0_g1_i2.p1  ORF type:complete len:273 (-),score=31.51 TRINITY_DN8506_c0_g1_i2:350-1123(-)
MERGETNIKTLFREIVQINKRSLYSDNQVEITFPNGEEDPYLLDLTLQISSGFFEGAKLRFQIQLPRTTGKPSFICKTPGLFHPNINGERVCFSMISGDWDPSYRLEHYINGILWLLNNPNHDSPLNSNAVVKGNGKRFRNRVLQSMLTHGYVIDGYVVEFLQDTNFDHQLSIRQSLWYGFLTQHKIPFDPKLQLICASPRPRLPLPVLKQMNWFANEKLIITYSMEGHVIMEKTMLNLIGSPVRRATKQDYQVRST